MEACNVERGKDCRKPFHRYLSENGLIKSMPEFSAPSFSVKRELGYRPTNGGSETVSQSP